MVYSKILNLDLLVHGPKPNERKQQQQKNKKIKKSNLGVLGNSNSLVSFRRTGRSQDGLVVKHELCT